MFCERTRRGASAVVVICVDSRDRSGVTTDVSVVTGDGLMSVFACSWECIYRRGLAPVRMLLRGVW
jgi:hypothetical protein